MLRHSFRARLQGFLFPFRCNQKKKVDRVENVMWMDERINPGKMFWMFPKSNIVQNANRNSQCYFHQAELVDNIFHTTNSVTLNIWTWFHRNNYGLVWCYLQISMKCCVFQLEIHWIWDCGILFNFRGKHCQTNFSLLSWLKASF